MKREVYSSLIVSLLFGSSCTVQEPQERIVSEQQASTEITKDNLSETEQTQESPILSEEMNEEEESMNSFRESPEIYKQ